MRKWAPVLVGVVEVVVFEPLLRHAGKQVEEDVEILLAELLMHDARLLQQVVDDLR